MAIRQGVERRSPGYSAAASIVIIALGIASFRASATSMFKYDADMGTQFSYALSMLVQVVAVISVIAFSDRLLKSRRALALVFWGSLAIVLAGTSLVLLSLDLDPASSTLAYDAGVALSGAGSAAALLGWGTSFCSLAPRQSAVAVCLGFFIHSILACLFDVLPKAFTLYSVFVFPIIASTLLAYYYYSRKESIRLYSTRTASLSPSQLPWGIISLLVLCYLTSSVLSVIVSGLTTPMTALLQPLVFGVSLGIVCLWIYALKRDDPESLWPMFVLGLLGCLLIYLTSWPSDSSLLVGLMATMKQWSMMFYWVLLAVLIYQLGLSPVVFFGLGNLLIGSVGRLIVEFSMSSVDGTQATLSATFFTSLIAVFAFLIVVAAFYALKSKRSLIPDKRAPEAGSNIEEAMNHIAQEYCLSKREIEVVGFLVRGYTFGQMGKEMFLSIDTVRSYSKTLYRKLGIHKKQELYSLIEQRAGSHLTETVR
ncbi:MAG: hypothetical protein HGA39_08810 [Coriobacteriia bacterium]|nr:hypothetical protein [Coriobacteriia bacterium]